MECLNRSLWGRRWLIGFTGEWLANDEDDVERGLNVYDDVLGWSDVDRVLASNPASLLLLLPLVRFSAPQSSVS